MCGIAGVFARDAAPVDPELVVRMRDSLAHRGPDDEGLWRRAGGDVVLGHRRLSIVDLTPAGRQPMANEDGSVVVTFNGEIYNHRDLRIWLERRGHVFRSQCDTEVLVHLYEERGRAMVEDLIGMFAFGVWDERRQELLLARDRLVIKPLYWLDAGARFAFASEIKGLVPLLDRHEMNEAALANYLTFVCVPPPQTLFRGIRKLPPASTLVVRRAGPGGPHVFWDPVAHGARELEDASPVEWGEELRFRLERSIERRMMSDVPVGVFLSGGVDSSTNVALMSRIAQPVRTFSIGFRGADEFNEFDWARRVANAYATEHREIEIGAGDLWEFMSELVFHQDEPIADPVCVPLYYVARLAKESGVTVVHVGEGADEILAGYRNYVTGYRMHSAWHVLRALPSPLRRMLAPMGGALDHVSPRHELYAEALTRAAADDAQLWWGGAVAFYERAARRVTTPTAWPHFDGGGPRSVVARIAAEAAVAGAHEDLQRMIYQDLRLRLPELLLMRVDKLTMASAVEARVPFLDHQLVELAMAMPASLKIDDGIGKVVLKRAVRDLLPDDLVWRPKHGFNAPVSQWFRGPLADELLAKLMRSAIHDTGLLDRDRIRTLVAEHRGGRADRGFQLWNLLNLAFWFDRWIAGRD